jgi:hypothetical protein
VLTEEEVAVVEGGGVDGYEEVVWAGRGGWDVLEGETVNVELALKVNKASCETVWNRERRRTGSKPAQAFQACRQLAQLLLLLAS